MNHARRSEARPIDLSSSSQASPQASRKSGNSDGAASSNSGGVVMVTTTGQLLFGIRRGVTPRLSEALSLFSRSQALKLSSDRLGKRSMREAYSMTEWVEAGLTFLAVLKVEALASECTAHLDALSPSHATCPSDQTTHTATASICPKEKSLSFFKGA